MVAYRGSDRARGGEARLGGARRGRHGTVTQEQFHNYAKGEAMNLTAERKEHIDSLPYASLLRRSRFAPVGDAWFQGETGTYWGKRMRAVRERGGNAAHVAARKAVGLDGGER